MTHKNLQEKIFFRERKIHLGTVKQSESSASNSCTEFQRRKILLQEGTSAKYFTKSAAGNYQRNSRGNLLIPDISVTSAHFFLQYQKIWSRVPRSGSFILILHTQANLKGLYRVGGSTSSAYLEFYRKKTARVNNFKLFLLYYLLCYRIFSRENA